jgi:energy-coupling factor transporter ATP-binding protein EcfA2
LTKQVEIEEKSFAKEDKEMEIIKKNLSKFYESQLLNSVNFHQELVRSLNDKEKKSLLLATLNFDELKNYLLILVKSYYDQDHPRKSTYTKFPAIVISSPNDLSINKDSVKISQISDSLDLKVAIVDKSPLFDFLENAKHNPLETHLMIIDFSKFSDKDRVAYNTIFDKTNRCLNKESIPDNVKIICIINSNETITDSSILSRFDEQYDLQEIPKSKLAIQDEDLSIKSLENIVRILEADCQGFQDWQSKLFGRVVQNGDNLQWLKSEFVKELELAILTNNELIFSFRNFSNRQKNEIKLLFDQAKILGYLDFYGYQIKFPKKFSIEFEKLEFNFTKILNDFEYSFSQDLSKPKLKIFKNFEISDSTPLSLLTTLQEINLGNFDKLLTKISINQDGQYHENQGIIEQTKNNHPPKLSLYITENLTTQQFYCLISKAKEHQIELAIYLAKGVAIPLKSAEDFKKFEEKLPIYPPSSALIDKVRRVPINPQRIIITNNINQALLEITQSINKSQILAVANNFSPKKINLVNVEDIFYSDLFTKIDYHLTTKDSQDKKFVFSLIIGQVQQKIQAGEIVILKGKFDDELLSLLHPHILDLEKKYQNLYFIFEEEIKKTTKELPKFSWLDSKSYLFKHYPLKEKIKLPLIEEPTVSITPEIPEDSVLQAQEFIVNRKNKLAELLSKNQILKITGHSGVGKSSLFLELEKNGLKASGDVKIFNELSNFQKFARDQSLQIKILVIDEYNTDFSTSFSMFRDFADNQSGIESQRGIFYKGEFYELSENHKVVFLGNPHNYGNRYKQKLFDDCLIQEFRLKDFPYSYIFENILKKPIYDKLSFDIKEKLSIDSFKKIASDKIKEYFDPMRKRFDALMKNPEEVENVLKEGKQKAQAQATIVLEKVRKACGLK